MPAILERTRADRIARFSALTSGRTFDLLVIGGGATGLGVALDAAHRGYSVALVEAADFAKGTSSRATKLLHGGVRYLAQGDIHLVREALHERTTLLTNAPHLTHRLPFVMPVYGRRGWLFDKWFYGAGLFLYDLLAGKAGLGTTSLLSRARTLALLPGVREQNLSGGVRYWDGQFDDARLAITLARTAQSCGAVLMNYCRVTGLAHEGDRLSGATVQDAESGQIGAIRARCVINAAGVWVDAIRRMDRAQVEDMVAPSQGVHIVVDQSFMPGGHALLVPKTRDGRVLFAVPWLGKLILGTTDTPRKDLAAEPEPFREEVEFILGEAGRYLARAPTRADVRSIWVGLRPLVRAPSTASPSTKKLSREHTVLVAPSGLVTVTGGKWTTYRAMAEDVLQRCSEDGLIEKRDGNSTEHLAMIGAPTTADTEMSAPPGLHAYGTDASTVLALDGHDRELAPGLSEAMVRFAVRHEYARTVEDMLARRSRLLFLDARLAAEVADAVGSIMASELGDGFDAQASVDSFRALASKYQLAP